MSRKFYWISNCRSQDCSKVRCSSSKPERYKSVEMYTIPVKSGFFRRMWFFIRLLSCCFCAFITLPHECTTHLIAPLEVCPMHSTLGYCTLLFNLLLELGSVYSAPVFFLFVKMFDLVGPAFCFLYLILLSVTLSFWNQQLARNVFYHNICFLRQYICNYRLEHCLKVFPAWLFTRHKLIKLLSIYSLRLQGALNRSTKCRISVYNVVQITDIKLISRKKKKF